MTPGTKSKNYARLLSVLTAAVTMTAALYFTACVSSRDQAREAAVEQETAEGESATTITRKQVTLSPVPSAVASLRLAAASLPDLPAGLPITSRNGRAEVKAERSGDSIIITATCDSLARQMEIVEEQLWQMTQQAETYKSQLEQAVKQRSNAVLTALKWLFAGIAAGVALTIIISKIYGSIRRR